MYEDDFSRENKVMGVLWVNKRDSGFWFVLFDWKECRFGIQVFLFLFIIEVLFFDVGFVRDFVNWIMFVLGREGVGEGWKGFVYVLEGIYDKDSVFEKVRNLKGFDDGNSFLNFLWWVYSRGEEEEECVGLRSYCWYGYYCY